MVDVPRALTGAPLRTFRPRDLASVYTQPSVQLHRLVRQGAVRRVAHGFYYSVPDDRPPAWSPSVEGLAAGVATAIFGERVPVLMHLTAARLLGALPRAVGLAYAAVPRQHAPIRLVDGPRVAVLTFVARAVEQLDAAPLPTDLGEVLVTTAEQTVLDLAKRPSLGGMPEESQACVRALLPRCDQAALADLARAQRMQRILDRLLADHTAAA